MALFLEAVQLRLFLLTCCCKLPPPWLCFDGKAASNLWGSCNRKGILPLILSASNSALLPFLSQTWHSHESFILMWHNQVLLGGLCGGRNHLELCQSKTCIVWGCPFLSPSLDISQALSCPLYFPCSGCYFPSSVPPCSHSMSYAKQTVVEVGCCRQWLGYRLHNFLNLTAQLRAIAGTVLQAVRCPWLCKSMCSCDQPSKEMKWEASSSWQRLSQKCITFMGEEGEGTRGRDTNFIFCVCLSIVTLLAWTFLGFTKSQNQLKYSL